MIRTAIRTMATSGLLILASFTTAFTAGTIQASAATVASSHTRLWWDGRTCAQYAAWERQSTAERFSVMARDARHADYYLRADVALWARHPRSAADRGYVAADCAGSYGL